MAALSIVKYGDSVLETKCEPVTSFGTLELRKLVVDMFETMYVARGVGLAAPQVGVSSQLTVIDTSSGEDPSKQLVLINPTIVKREGSQIGEEGCLSIPGFREDVRRAAHVVVRAKDIDGNDIEVEGEELLARALQHEIDHLHGILFIDRMNTAAKASVANRLKRLQREVRRG